MHSNDHERIWLGSSAFEELNRLLGENDYSRIIFLVDENTHTHCLPLLMRELGQLPATEVLEVEPGEDSKKPEVITQLWYALQELGADRHSLIINVGGGVVTDLGGFLAGTFLRGLPFVNVPTSLLAMVDASVGGKNGLNLQDDKNRVGLFLEPSAICVMPDFLASLPWRERRSGFAEMLKHGLISDARYWEQLTQQNIADTTPGIDLIARSIELKKAVVKQDFRESGTRKILNFGHTVGHALESVSLRSDQALLHGEAIALGMMVELRLSEVYTGLSKTSAGQAREVIRAVFKDVKVHAAADQLLPVMQRDKKNKGQELHFALLKELGHAIPDVSVPGQAVVKALEELF